MKKSKLTTEQKFRNFLRKEIKSILKEVSSKIEYVMVDDMNDPVIITAFDSHESANHAAAILDSADSAYQYSYFDYIKKADKVHPELMKKIKKVVSLSDIESIEDADKMATFLSKYDVSIEGWEYDDYA